MRDEEKSKEQLLAELKSLRARLAKQEQSFGEKAPLTPSTLRGDDVFYQAIFEDLTELIIRFQPDGTLTFVNDAYCRFYGETREELMGRSFWHHMPEEEQGKLRAFLDSLTREDTIRTIEHSVIDSSGVVRWLQWTDRAFFDESGQISGFQAVGRDITDKRDAEKALKESEERFRSLAESSTDYIMRYDDECRHLYVNPACARVSGIPQEKFIGHTHQELGFDPLHCTAWEEKIRKAFDTATQQQWDFDYDGADGKVYLDWRIVPELSPDGQVKTVLGVSRDITERVLMEKALREAHNRLDTIIEFLPDATLVIDRDGKVVAWNRSIEYMTGVSKAEMIGKGDYEYAIPFYGERRPILIDLALSLDHDFESRKYDHVIRHGDVLYGEVYVPNTYGGRGAYLWGTASVLRDDRGNIFAAIESIRDITERKQAEQNFRESEERYRFLVNSVGVVVWRGDPDSFQFTFVSREAENLLGYPARQWVEESDFWLNHLHPEDRERCSESCRQAMELRVSHEFEYRMIGADGRVVWVRDIVKLKVEDTEVAEVVGVMVDISERKRAEEALAHSHDLMRYIIEHNRSAIAVHDRDLKYIYVSQRYLEDYNVKEDDVIGKHHYDIFPDLPQKWRDAHRKALAGEISSAEDDPYVRKDGAVEWTRWECRPWYEADGSIGGIIVYTEVITERKRAEEERVKLQAQLNQAQKMESVGRLAGGVAHDFNNMLSVILGHTEMAMEQVDPAQPLFADLREIEKAAGRSADLTRQLLAFARKQTISPRVLDLNETVAGMLNMLRRLIGEDIDLAWLPDKKLWPVKVDPSQIDQILANLCVNARDAIAGVGKITIETGTTVFDEAYCADHAGFVAGEFVLLAVSDNGCGMEKETLDKVFEPFFTTKDLGKGTGLGLATVYGIVKQNNGFINVYSEPGKGTTLKIYLPRHAAGAERMQKVGPPVVAKGGAETILLVEDELSILNMTMRMLERLGYVVLAAGTPGEAIRLAEEHPGEIHLLMTDVVMPEMNGRDLAKNLLTFHPNLKRLFMSGYTANVIAHHGVLDQGVNFIQKPFSRQGLADKLRDVLGGKDE